MMVEKEIKAADLFCGAGGTSRGLLEACQQMGFKLDLIAINHWPVAISTHQANHPYAQHLCTSLDNVNPRELVPGGRLNLLVASPECTHHSNARGGRPMSDQSRASAWCILRWAEALYIDNIIIENVKEFRSWGPLGANGRPIKRLKGQLFQQFIESLKALGYQAEHRILNAADYGDPTTRQRLFVIARRGGKRVVWPAASHCNPATLKRKSGELFVRPTLAPWVPAREIIDWKIPGKSIFGRKKPLAQKTLQRIHAGLERFGGPNAEPYLIILRQHMASQSVDSPLPTLTAGGNHIGLVEPFVFAHQRRGNNATSVDEPIQTLTATSSDFALVEPVILPHDMFEQSPVDSIDQPLRTLVGKNARQVRVCEPVLTPIDPFLLDINHGLKEGECPAKEGRRRSHSLESPLGTVTTNRGKALVEPFMLNIDHHGGNGNQVRSVDAPLSTQTTKARTAVVEPIIMTMKGKSADCSRPVDQPLPTHTTKQAQALVEPMLVSYYGNGNAQPTSHPIPTITTKDRFALVTIGDETYALDIRLRMLQAHELAAAMSMGGYKFTGKAEEQVKQIGNAVPVKLAKALCMEAIS